jgi:hypothetical protein
MIEWVAHYIHIMAIQRKVLDTGSFLEGGNCWYKGMFYTTWYNFQMVQYACVGWGLAA